MYFKALHPNFRLPERSTSGAGAYDLFMPTAGHLTPNGNFGLAVPLGFAAEVPTGHVALLLPRSGVGSKNGLMLNNTCGVIDADYRGEWIANLRVLNNTPFEWMAGARLLQMLLVPVAHVVPVLVSELSSTDRGAGGFGSTGT